MNSVCELFKGANKSDWEPESMQEMQYRFRSGGIGKSELYKMYTQFDEI